MHPWYPHYLADYESKTCHLTLIEHGAYRLLMDLAYRREGQVPSDLRALYKMVRATSRQEHAAIRSILGQFWVLSGNSYRNSRIDEELHKRQELSQKRSASAKQMHSKCSAIASDLHDTSHHIHITSQEKEKTIKKEMPLALLAEFEDFWKSYPRKTAKRAAFKAYEKARREGTEATLILDASKAFCAVRASEDPKYTPHPATWLNQGRWADVEITRAVLNGHDPLAELRAKAQAAEAEAIERRKANGLAQPH